MDATDLAILELLRQNGRIGGAEIARRVNLSQPAVSARIKRLEAIGVITGYQALVDHDKLGSPIHAVVRLRTTHANIAPALDLFARQPEIDRVYRLTGEDCFLIDLHVSDARSLEAIVDRIARLGPVTTALVLRDYTKDSATPGPPEAAARSVEAPATGRAQS